MDEELAKGGNHSFILVFEEGCPEKSCQPDKKTHKAHLLVQ